MRISLRVPSACPSLLFGSLFEYTGRATGWILLVVWCDRPRCNGVAAGGRLCTAFCAQPDTCSPAARSTIASVWTPCPFYRTRLRTVCAPVAEAGTMYVSLQYPQRKHRPSSWPLMIFWTASPSIIQIAAGRHDQVTLSSRTTNRRASQVSRAPPKAGRAGVARRRRYSSG